MSTEPGSPRYWLDLFTEETWIEAARYGFTVTGFSEGRWATVERIRPGDVLVCYLTGRSTYVGLLRVTGSAFKDTKPIWKSQPFPSRLPISLGLALRPDAGVPVHDMRNRLSYFHNLTSPHAWTGHFRGSPAAIKPEDAAAIVAALREAAADPERVLDPANPPEPQTKTTRRGRGAAPPEPTPTASRTPAPSPQTAGSPAVRALEAEHELLGRRLVTASTASDDAAAFEVALADAFAFLGFQAELRSGSGDTDVLATAPLGDEAYAAVVDGKATKQGRVGNQQIDWFALGRHKERHEADHVLVVAAAFSGGELARDAERTGAALLTSGDLAEVLRLHAATPFTLAALRDLFRYPGKPDLPLSRMQEHHREAMRLQRLLPDIVDAIEEAYRYELYDPVNVDSLLMPLASRRGRRPYSREEITAALELLCVPQLGVLRRVSEGRYTLQMPKVTLTRRLRALVAVFDAPPGDLDVDERPESRIGQG